MLVKDTSFNELEDLLELETGSALHQNVNLLLADLECSTCSGRGQVSSALGGFCKESTEDAVRLMSNVAPSGAHAHISSSGPAFFHWNKRLHR